MRTWFAAAVCAAIVSGTFGPAARAGYITKIFAFGDSLSDAGNLYAVSGQPPAPYYNGHFSNGKVWVEYLADRLGVAAPTASVTGGTNFAWASAETGAGFSPKYGVPNLQTQVAGFIGGGGKLNDTNLVTVWAGPNDVFDGKTDPAAMVDNLAGAVTALAGAGGKRFLVPNMPYLDTTPDAQTLTPAERAGLHLLALGFNAGLAAKMQQLEGSLGVSIDVLDVATLFADVQANAAKYGYTNTTTSAVGDGAYTGQGYLFWDSVHPTTAGHQVLGDTAAALVTPEPSALAIVVAAGSGLAAWRLRRQAAQ